MPTTPQTWLITGCSSGFGEFFVRQLRAQGDNVIATGRNAATKLAHLKDTGASILDLDVAAPVPEIEAKMAEAWGLYPNGTDVVVNNAGYILSGVFEELTSRKSREQDMLACFKTNFHGPLNITRALLPRLRAKGKGTMLFMSSQAGFHADANATGYVATKHALEGAVECRSKELAIFAPDIKVLLVEPSYFRTRAFGNINRVPQHITLYAEFNKAVFDAVTSAVAKEPGTRTRRSRS
ncbi:Uu.00g116660.m01.CDS01 [Anthostomella pinea]|uniref:Uu.00g116660.m01.CDS01 n=1 Tax=Anthostomella pinea TaxID=933095 RepID=A0AAI8VG48_9PEZI|nr:Uu.00g116660.m01.CDS01 [Anthostomella pinea]